MWYYGMRQNVVKSKPDCNTPNKISFYNTCKCSSLELECHKSENCLKPERFVPCASKIPFFPENMIIFIKMQTKLEYWNFFFLKYDCFYKDADIAGIRLVSGTVLYRGVDL